MKPLLFFLLLLFASTTVRARIAGDTCTPLKLDPQGSVLYWPSPPATPQNSMGWGSWGNQPGQAGHVGSDFYALDWSRQGAGVCDSPFLAPLGGRVTIVNALCPTLCSASPLQCGAYGNQVVIESNLASGYYFRVAHLRTVTVQQNDLVQPGQLIGYVGSTGNSTGPHAHCVLYRNTDAFLSGINTTGNGPDGHAVPFSFAANCNVVTSLPAFPTQTDVELGPNPTASDLRVQVREGGLYTWTLFDLQGRSLLRGRASGATTIRLAHLPPGIYLVELQTRKSVVRKKILRQ